MANAHGFDGAFSPEKQADSCAPQLCVFCPAFLYQGMKMERMPLKLLSFSINFFSSAPLLSRNKCYDFLGWSRDSQESH